MGNRRHRRDNAKGGKKLAAAVEPGFGIQANEPGKLVLLVISIIDSKLT